MTDPRSKAEQVRRYQRASKHFRTHDEEKRLREESRRRRSRRAEPGDVGDDVLDPDAPAYEKIRRAERVDLKRPDDPASPASPASPGSPAPGGATSGGATSGGATSPAAASDATAGVSAAHGSDAASSTWRGGALVVEVHRRSARVRLPSGDVVKALPPPPAPDREGAAVVVGDFVEVAPHGDTLRVQVVHPRSTVLARSVPGSDRCERVLAANVDVAVIVSSATTPPLRTGLIDRYLVILEHGGIRPVLCLNKVDQLDEEPSAASARERLEERLEPYAALGVPILWTSATRGDGIDELRERLHGRTCVFTGHSGVGKSALLNAVDPDTERRTGALDARRSRGRHTTTSASLRELTDGTRVIDTPGIRSLSVGHFAPSDLRESFPEITAAAAQCRFRDCTHLVEPHCAVREAVARGEIRAARFASYERLLQSDETA